MACKDAHFGRRAGSPPWSNCHIRQSSPRKRSDVGVREFLCDTHHPSLHQAPRYRHGTPLFDSRQIPSFLGSTRSFFGAFPAVHKGPRRPTPPLRRRCCRLPFHDLFRRNEWCWKPYRRYRLFHRSRTPSGKMNSGGPPTGGIRRKNHRLPLWEIRTGCASAIFPLNSSCIALIIAMNSARPILVRL